MTEPVAPVAAPAASAAPVTSAAAPEASNAPGILGVAPVAPAGASPAVPAAPTAPAAPAAPAVAEYDFKFSEGLNLSDALKGEFTAWAQEGKLDPKAAQGAAELTSKAVEHVAERHMSQIYDLYTKWADESRNDKEFGGEQFDSNANIANAALQQFGTPELTKVLKETGLGVHPEMVRVFYRIGKLISQDSVAGAIASAASAEKTQAQRMYGG